MVSNPLNEMLARLGIEWMRGESARWQRKMRDSQGAWCLRNEEMKKWPVRRGEGGGGGFKNKWANGSSFSQTHLRFRTV